jgi:hypothetical protein
VPRPRQIGKKLEEVFQLVAVDVRNQPRLAGVGRRLHAVLERLLTDGALGRWHA